ncbi:IclR family transcriptional regulator [Variovorax sp. KK3]|uniref:IclR family transcriptional regulator n=1 Tax=Variovorax sp. KK3 TaxID=1855728 RepID=UPI00097C4CB5|nr:IclR family transcriptional regulator C-terminal domain-containing protein [Variovorax sp. KK3]
MLDSSFAKGLSVLDVFKEGRISVHLDEVVDMLGTSKATAYRYLATLCEAGLLAAARGGVYMLGPRIIELDRAIRISDPLLRAGSKVMRELSDRLEINMLLASYYRDSIMCVDIAWPDPAIPSHHERGLPMSLFQGAMAKIILAHLSQYQLRTLALHHLNEIREGGMGQNWTEFRAHMAALARQGYSVTYSELFEGAVGVSAPILDPDQKILGSITFALTDERWRASKQEDLCAEIMEAAARVNALIAMEADDSVGDAVPSPAPPMVTSRQSPPASARKTRRTRT